MEMGFASGLEDDLFYADLSRRISQLIMDEEEEFPEQCPDTAASFQAYSYGSQSFYAQAPLIHEAAFRRETKGTGVFIPRSSQTRKSRRPGRSRQGEKARGAVAAPPTTTNTSRCRSSSAVLKNQT